MASMSLHTTCHTCGWNKTFAQQDDMLELDACLQCGSANIENEWVTGNPLQNALSDAINRVFGQD